MDDARTVLDFIREAHEAGFYSATQARLLTTAVAQLAKPLATDTSIQILEMRLEDPHAFGGVTESSRQSYRTRVGKAFRDFRRWAGRLHQWTGRGDPPQARSQQELFSREEIHSIPIGPGRNAELRYPRDLSQREARVLADQLVIIARLLEARAIAMEGETSSQ